MNQLIAPTTGAATSEAVDTRSYTQISFICPNDSLGLGESVKVQVLAGSAFVDLEDNSGTLVEMTSAKGQVNLEAGPTYRVVKSGTIASIGVYWAGGVR